MLQYICYTTVALELEPPPLHFVMLPFSRYSGSSRIKDMDSFLNFLVSSLVFLTMAVMQLEIVCCCNAQDFHRVTTVAINCTF